MAWHCLDLADFLLIAEAVLAIPAEDQARARRLELAESTLHAPAAEFGGVDLYEPRWDLDQLVAHFGRVAGASPAGSSSASRLTSSPFCYASSRSRPFGCRPGCSSSSSSTPSMGSGSLRASRCSAPRAGRSGVRPGRRHLGARQRPASGPSYVSEVFMTRGRTDHDRLPMPVTDQVPGGGSWRLVGMSRWACSTRRTSR